MGVLAIRKKFPKKKAPEVGRSVVAEQIHEQPIPQPEPPGEAPFDLSEDELWFLNEDQVAFLPREPFMLTEGVKVVDPERFFDALIQDIGDPTSPRRASGALANDLKKLRLLCLCE